MTADAGQARAGHPQGDRTAQRPVNVGAGIQLAVGDAVLRGTLLDTPAGRDFAALLPLTLTLRDYAGTEKISDLPARLSTAEASAGTAADVGDVAYYAPWGNLAIFYRPAGYAQGLVVLGHLETGIERLAAVGGDIPITIAVAPYSALRRGPTARSGGQGVPGSTPSAQALPGHRQPAFPEHEGDHRPPER
jgi:hypothetical protein